MLISKNFILWFAGFFDGEGCIHLAKRFRKNKIQPEFELRLVIAQVKSVPLELIKLNLNGNLRQREERVYEWTCSTKDSIRILKLITPYLIVKKKEAKLALEYEKLIVGKGNKITLDIIKSRDILANKIKQLKSVNNL